MPAADALPTGHPVARARSVAEQLAASRLRIETARELPPDVLEALHAARLFRLLLPRSIGGDETDLVTVATVLEEIAAADASAAWCVGQANGCAMSAAFLDLETSRRVFGPRDAVLAWGAGAAGQAVETEGGYRVTGRWQFASGSRGATWIGGHCKVLAADGAVRERPRTMLFVRHKARMIDDWQVMGLKGTGSDSYSVDDLFVPAAETLDREDLSTAREPGPLYRFSTMMAYAAGFAGVMLGIARGMLDDLTALATAKTQRGAASSLRESAVFQGDLARMHARWRAARAYHHTTFAHVWCEVADRGRPLALDLRADARLAATHTINEAAQVVVDAYRAAGADAVLEKNPFERRLRDALSASQQVQGRPAHYTTVGRVLLGLPPDTSGFV